MCQNQLKKLKIILMTQNQQKNEDYDPDEFNHEQI